MKQLALLLLLTVGVQAQIAHFNHVIIVAQENRTPDNIFHGLCGLPQYDIACGMWAHAGQLVNPTPVSLTAPYDIGHSHFAWVQQWHKGALDGTPQCTGTCPVAPNSHYVDNSSGILNPYLTLATQYGWANDMFQTNQGPSYPAHQFLFGGTSAPDAASDAAGIFVAENKGTISGCLSAPTALAQLINAAGVELSTNKVYPCFEHQTMADLGLSWKYYTPGPKNIWTAPTSIQHICQPVIAGKCAGSQWANVVLNPANVLTAIANGSLSQISWVIPTGQCSDHAGTNSGCGPAWVASIVNAVGQSPYWQDTAIIVTWDDWGGWYDHVAPPNGNTGYAALGFRVPLLFISAYTAAGTVSNTQSDFGSILRFIEYNFGYTRGNLGFADARASSDLSEFYDFTQVPRTFSQITVSGRAKAELKREMKKKATDPDDDN